MKFIHIADLHFDAPFVNLSDKSSFGDLKRIEQRKVFKKIIEYIKKESIPYLFIAGDLYEQKYIKLSTIKYINDLFSSIPETKIYITPGNHDPYLKNSYYNKYEWAQNVKIFKSEIERIELEDVDIYGYGFDDFYCTEFNLDELEIVNKEKVNIFITHATLDGATLEEKQYNSISRKELLAKNFDYVALGHIHKTNYNKNEIKQNIIYPGSPVALGFDEIGTHGIILGDIEKEKIELKYIPISDSEFKEIYLDITQIISKEELIEKIQELEINENEFIKIILIGKRNFEINIYELYNLNINERIIKIKDKTKINYNLEKMKNETTLKGLFIQEMLEKLDKCENNQEEKDLIEKAIEVGLEALE